MSELRTTNIWRDAACILDTLGIKPLADFTSAPVTGGQIFFTKRIGMKPRLSLIIGTRRDTENLATLKRAITAPIIPFDEPLVDDAVLSRFQLHLDQDEMQDIGFTKPSYIADIPNAQIINNGRFPIESTHGVVVLQRALSFNTMEQIHDQLSKAQPEIYELSGCPKGQATQRMDYRPEHRQRRQIRSQLAI